jgi:hypothetical protein
MQKHFYKGESQFAFFLLQIAWEYLFPNRLDSHLHYNDNFSCELMFIRHILSYILDKYNIQCSATYESNNLTIYTGSPPYAVHKDIHSLLKRSSIQKHLTEKVDELRK